MSLVVLVCFFCVHPILAAKLFMQSLTQATDSVSWTEQKKNEVRGHLTLHKRVKKRAK